MPTLQILIDPLPFSFLTLHPIHPFLYQEEGMVAGKGLERWRGWDKYWMRRMFCPSFLMLHLSLLMFPCPS